MQAETHLLEASKHAAWMENTARQSKAEAARQELREKANHPDAAKSVVGKVVVDQQDLSAKERSWRGVLCGGLSSDRWLVTKQD